MASEGEVCVDKLLVMNNEIDRLCVRLDSSVTGELIEESRQMLKQTQLYVDNNRLLIPPYILKKVSDSLRRLEKHTNGPDKSKLTFKFNSKPSRSSPKLKTKDFVETENRAIATEDAKSEMASLGFRDTSNEELSLGSNEVDSRDVSLINLNTCSVNISGLASTVYIKDLKDSTVTICLACRAITVRDCTNCKFKFVCQQLRIDSTTNCKFEVFTSARSMLESSTGLSFGRLDLDELVESKNITSEQLTSLVEAAKFNRHQNNWNCIDDFDWLSPDKPSKNYVLCGTGRID